MAGAGAPAARSPLGRRSRMVSMTPAWLRCRAISQLEVTDVLAKEHLHVLINQIGDFDVVSLST